MSGAVGQETLPLALSELLLLSRPDARGRRPLPSFSGRNCPPLFLFPTFKTRFVPTFFHCTLLSIYRMLRKFALPGNPVEALNRYEATFVFSDF